MSVQATFSPWSKGKPKWGNKTHAPHLEVVFFLFVLFLESNRHPFEQMSRYLASDDMRTLRSQGAR